MRYPVDWVAIVRGLDLNKKSKNYHKGVDFGWYSKPHKYQPVYAVADGTVNYKKVQETGGKTIHINHGKVCSAYGHLDSWCVKDGQKVRMGEKIGTMGETGEVTAQHLHTALCKGSEITYTKKDKWLNPCDYFCLFDNQHTKNLKTKLKVKYHSKKATTDLWIHNAKNYKESSRVYILKKGEEIAYYGKENGYALVDKINGYYCSAKYLK